MIEQCSDGYLNHSWIGDQMAPAHVAFPDVKCQRCGVRMLWKEHRAIREQLRETAAEQAAMNALFMRMLPESAQGLAPQRLHRAT